MIKFFLLSITSFGLIGCMSISPTSFKGPSGKQAYSMMCSGMGRTMDACYQKAGEVCPMATTLLTAARVQLVL